MKLQIELLRGSKVFKSGDKVLGNVILTLDVKEKHEGVSVSINGKVSISASKNLMQGDDPESGDAHLPLLGYAIELLKPGRIPTGVTRLPFQFPLETNMPRAKLYETYHGVRISITYMLRAEVKKGRLQQNISQSQEVFVEDEPSALSDPGKSAVPFQMTPYNLKSAYPITMNGFKVSGFLESAECKVQSPLLGQVVIEESQMAISSIDLQLLRTETVSGPGALTKDGVDFKETSEIQTIQIGHGDVMRGVPIDIRMLFPRYFTAVTTNVATATKSISVDYSVNIIVIFEGDHVVSKNIPLVMIR